MTGFVAFVASVILVASELVIDIDGSQIDSKPVPIEMVPYIVSIRLKNYHHCSGSIISSKFVLTAGICAKFAPSKYKVQAGSATELIGGSMHSVDQVIQYGGYLDSDGLPENDIALLKVNPPFKFDETRAKVPLSEKETLFGINATVVGWGKSVESSTHSFTLQAVNVPIINKDKCRKAYENIAKITENAICAGFAGKDFFAGVSGAPLVVDGVQVGVLSWGLLAEDTDKPDVYTEVAKFNSWIKNYISDP